MMNNKIPFYAERSFGEKFNVVFSFLKQNWRYMLRYILYGVLPLSLLAALSVDNLMSGTMNAVGDGPVNTGLNYSATIFSCRWFVCWSVCGSAPSCSLVCSCTMNEPMVWRTSPLQTSNHTPSEMPDASSSVDWQAYP